MKMAAPVKESTPLLKAQSTYTEVDIDDLEDPKARKVSVWQLRMLLVPYFWPKTWALRFRVALAFVLMLGSRGFKVLAPLFLRQATNELSVSPLVALPYFAIGMYCVSLFWFSCAKQLQTYIYMTVKQHAYQDVAAKLFGHLHELSMHFHLTKKTGKVLRCLDRGSSSTDSIVNVIFFRLLPTLIEVGVVSAIFVVSFKEKILTYVCLSGIALYIIITAVGTHFRLKFKKQTNQHDNKASEKAVDSLTNFETVKYFCTEEYELNRYMWSINLFQVSQLSTRGLLNAIVGMQQFIQQTCLVVCLLIVARNIRAGTMTIGDFVAVAAYVANIFKPLDSLGNIYNTIVQSFVDMESLVELLLVDPDVKDKPNALPLVVHRDASKVEFRDVSFVYPSQPEANGLKNVSFTVPSGETTAIVGPTGSGKTTISRLLFRFYDVARGSVIINDQDISAVRQKSLRQNIGIVPQDTVMFNDSIRYNVRLRCCIDG
ncbi:TPA: hypothetical protein N0F65_000032 [Lagenidium giganteum]|uniref:ABC transmembrane type-1 domain-containing protein n=1 Tax=Lagenidium giganteum TaxID=4803 RepID=A0AAV2YM10_9STRA|nr:TPA: hypothetical protein N0F65_000032 [Lagenidium giganteum]